MMRHPDGINVPDAVAKTFKNQVEHDPSNLNEGREIAGQANGIYPIGLFYKNLQAERYDEFTAYGMEMGPSAKIEAVNAALDSFMV
jgi:hypothetical protein